jgi:formate hydrogenlyase subunit 7
MGRHDKIVPVDVYIPGCPPTPAATLYGFAMALGLPEQKFTHVRRVNWTNSPPKFCIRIWFSRCE